MATPMDPFSGRYSMSSEVHPIPNWEKGSKVSLSSEEGNDYTEGYWDSSDLSGVSSGSSSDDDAEADAERSVSSPSSSGHGRGMGILADLDKTPKAASRVSRKLHRSVASNDTDVMSISKETHVGNIPCTDKGKGKAVLVSDHNHQETDEQDNSAAESVASSSPGSERNIIKHKTRRPRSHSNTSKGALSPSFLNAVPSSLPSPPSSSPSSTLTFSKRAPGPAAQAMADLMSAEARSSASTSATTSTSTSPSHLKSTPSNTLTSQRLLPASSLHGPLGVSVATDAAGNGRRSLLGSRPLTRTQAIASNRQLGRAKTAPNNLFSESVPTNNLFSPGRSPLHRINHEDDDETISCPGSPQADIQTIIDTAFDEKKDSIDLSRRNLVRLPPIIFELSHFETLDLRTDKCSPTPIYLDLSNNYLNAAGLTPLLFNITNLSVLSLRSNQIESLPQSIGNLKNLKKLLLFANKLTYLPAEILDLKLEMLQLGSNRFPTYSSPDETKSDKVGEKEIAQESQSKESSDPVTKMKKLDPSIKPVCEPRKLAFKVPSLLELCTRRLLEPADSHRDSFNDASVVTKAKLFTPGMVSTSNGTIKRNFHAVKDKILSPRTDVAPIPPHLLKPFLPLLQPLPHHLRCLLSPVSSPSMEEHNRILPSPIVPSISGGGHTRTHSNASSTPFESIREIPQCSKCKTACSQFAEYRIEWRHEIAGVVFGKSDDPRCWIPVLWRGCSANCLDDLEK